jgi:glyoxylase-like metal-dependent hydrolase (beta-lactamase superfamily II)
VAIWQGVKIVKPGDEVVSGHTIVGTPGHTQGHVSLMPAGGDALAHQLISFQHPEWKPGADKARQIGCHLPYQGLGTVERKNEVYRFAAAA